MGPCLVWGENSSVSLLIRQCQDYHPQKHPEAVMEMLPHSSVQPLTQAAERIILQHSCPPQVNSQTNIFKGPPGGICRLLHVSRRLGCNWLVYSEERMEHATASCFAPLEQIHRRSPLLILISLCCSQHSLLILLSRSRSQPFPALISKNKNKNMSENKCQ